MSLSQEQADLKLAQVIAKRLNRIMSGSEAVRATVQEVIASRVTISEAPHVRALCEHPSVQIGTLGDGDDQMATVGMLGILNGLIGSQHDGYGYLFAVFEDPETEGGRAKLIRFEARKR